ncbi:MAG: transcriptional repressor LexA [candidate division Zixibacteria bacterium]|nr:transcriptional repressor LexA [candidate division Zixibacteria bacterium]
MSKVLYKRQRETLGFLHKFISDKGFAPTIREIAEGIGVKSPATVEEHLQTLERKGVIKRTLGKRRAIDIMPEFAEMPENRVPILGQIAAGQPIEAIEDKSSFVEYAEPKPGEELFSLKVNGDSMIEDGIFDGDLVVIRKQETCANGEVAVALLDDGSATLKRIFREKKRIRLQPANADLDPIYVDNIRIQGKVVGLIRRF